ncbi:uncharacterized protein BXZ73DRAFT_14455, partial [Epithele typhae]|uniref:uncharacterized protein n=1 Tax=Epithele typhae TaxID=378194 RepID=UPI00200762B2
QLLGVACDSASANLAMIKTMEKGLQKFRASSGHVACFGHVIQLVGRGLLDQFDPDKKKPGEEDNIAAEGDEDAEDAE